MDELKSLLPPPEEVKALMSMTITTILLKNCPHVYAKLNFEADGKPITASLYRIDDEKVMGYLPSKAWYEYKNGPRLLYYISPTLPSAARPFGGKPVYCFTYPVEDHTITYNVEWRVFIDQLVTPGETLLVVMFSEDLYDDIVIEENEV